MTYKRLDFIEKFKNAKTDRILEKIRDYHEQITIDDFIVSLGAVPPVHQKVVFDVLLNFEKKRKEYNANCFWESNKLKPLKELGIIGEILSNLKQWGESNRTDERLKNFLKYYETQQRLSAESADDSPEHLSNSMSATSSSINLQNEEQLDVASIEIQPDKEMTKTLLSENKIGAIYAIRLFPNDLEIITMALKNALEIKSELKEPMSSDYIYVDKDNHVHLLLPIVGGERIGLDNTCKTVIELKKFFIDGDAKAALEKYDKALDLDIQLLDKNNLPFAAQKARQEQIKNYIQLIDDVSQQDGIRKNLDDKHPKFPDEINNILKKQTNCLSVVLSPNEPDGQLRTPNPIFKLERGEDLERDGDRMDAEGYPITRRVINEGFRKYLFEGLKNFKFDGCSLKNPLISKLKKKFGDKSLKELNISFDDLRKELIDIIEIELHETVTLNKDNRGNTVNEEYLETFLSINFDSDGIEEIADNILNTTLSNDFWSAVSHSPFLNLKSVDQCSIAAQFLLAEVNLFCRANDMSQQDFSKLCDSTPHGVEITRVLEQALKSGENVEDEILKYINQNHQDFGLRSKLSDEQMQVIKTNFKSDYSTIKHAPNFDEFIFFQEGCPGDFVNHKNRISMNFYDYAKELEQSLSKASQESLKNLEKNWQSYHQNLEGKKLVNSAFDDHQLIVMRLLKLDIDKFISLISSDGLITPKLAIKAYPESLDVIKQCFQVQPEVVFEAIDKGELRLEQLIRALPENHKVILHTLKKDPSLLQYADEEELGKLIKTSGPITPRKIFQIFPDNIFLEQKAYEEDPDVLLELPDDVVEKFVSRFQQSLDMKEPSKADYIYIDSDNNVHLLMPIVGGGQIGLDNTCKSVIEMQDFITNGKALEQLNLYQKTLEYDIKNVKDYPLLLKLKQARLEQINTYIKIVEEISQNKKINEPLLGDYPNYPEAVKRILRRKTNLVSCQLSPEYPDYLTRGENPVFSLKRPDGGYYDTLIHAFRPTTYPEGLAKSLRASLINSSQKMTSPKQLLINEVVSDLITKYGATNLTGNGNFNNTRLKLSQLKDMLAAKIKAQTGQDIRLDEDNRGTKLDDDYFTIILPDYLNDNNLENVALTLLNQGTKDEFWQLHFKQSPLTYLEGDKLLTAIQFFLAEVNIYCNTNNISSKNFGSLLDIAPFRDELTGVIKHALQQEKNVEYVIMNYINEHQEKFGLTHGLSAQEQKNIVKNFNNDYMTIKSSDNFDEFMFFVAGCPGDFVNHQNRISMHIGDFLKEMYGELKPSTHRHFQKFKKSYDYYHANLEGKVLDHKNATLLNENLVMCFVEEIKVKKIKVQISRAFEQTYDEAEQSVVRKDIFNRLIREHGLSVLNSLGTEQLALLFHHDKFNVLEYIDQFSKLDLHVLQSLLNQPVNDLDQKSLDILNRIIEEKIIQTNNQLIKKRDENLTSCNWFIDKYASFTRDKKEFLLQKYAYNLSIAVVKNDEAEIEKFSKKLFITACKTRGSITEFSTSTHSAHALIKKIRARASKPTIFQ